MKIDWNTINSFESLSEALDKSYLQNIIIFKHSTTCSISHMAKMRLESDWNLDEIPTYYLDIKQFRKLSDSISETLEIHHESPQILLIRNGQCTYDASHFDISVEEINETIVWHKTQKFASDMQ
ncbi:MAG: bacillithiol system redox-active protein YtxJ [Saprospiraceae bacterium]